MTRRNAVPIGKQRGLFEPDREFGIEAPWWMATPHELQEAIWSGALTDEDLRDIEDLTEQGTVALREAGASSAFARALVRGEIEGLGRLLLVERFMDDGGDSKAVWEEVAKSLELKPLWRPGVGFQWCVLDLPVYEDGEHVRDDAFLVRMLKDSVDVELASSAVERIGSSIDPADYFEHVYGDGSDFWDSPVPLYHATPGRNLSSILKKGLLPQDESRGLRNRGVSDAVFTTSNLDRASDGMYGDVVLEIDTLAMRRESVMPDVSAEPDVIEAEAAQALAHALGDDNYVFEAENDPTTLILHGAVPPRFLRVIE